MDLFITFLVANVSLCAMVVIASIVTHPRVSSAARKLVSKVNMPGVSGAVAGLTTMTVVSAMFL